MTKAIVFHPGAHRYIEVGTGKELTSVSKVLNHYEGEFDTIFWTHYKAVEQIFGTKTARYARWNYGYGSNEKERILLWVEQELAFEEKKLVLKAVKEIKEKWRRKSYNARRSGSRRHDKLERSINKASVIIKNDIPYEPMPNFACDVPDFESRGIATEVTVYNKEFMISGRVDRIDKDGRDLDVVDYKTSKDIEYENKWENFKAPLDFLQKCNYNRYSLQLNTYGWMFTQFGFNIKKLTLVHDRSKESISVPIDFDMIELMLKHWKRHGTKTSSASNKDPEAY